MKRLYVPGVFDVFHVGHLNYLKNASTAGDHIIVGVQDDRSVAECKKVMPVIPLADRMAIIESLRFVDEVVSYTDVFQGPLLEGLEVDVFAVGEEYGETDLYPDQRKTLQFCRERGIEVFRIPRTQGVSSTQVRGELRKFWNSRARLQRDLTAGVTVLGSFRGDQQKVDAQTKIEVQAVLDAVSQSETKSLLDLGCGDGRQLAPLCPYFDKVVGVDFAGDLLKIAQQRIAERGASAELVEADVSEFLIEQTFDVLLLSGIIPYLDDMQFHQMLANVRSMSHENSKILVRSSIGLNKRVDVVNQFSLDLKERYTAYYRKVEEIEAAFRQHGWTNIKSNLLYQHREDTAVWWFELEQQEMPAMKRAAA